MAYDASFFRTRAGAEIDLVLTKGLQVELAVEIKYGLAPKLTKSFWNAHATLQPRRTYVVYPGQERYPIKEDVWALPVTQLQRLFE